MSDGIVILGGTGAVGRAVAETLAPLHPGLVAIAGRDLRRAAAIAADLPGAVTAAQVDLADPGSMVDLLDGARLVVQCIEVGDAEVARRCFERGVHHVDVSASSEVLGAIAGADGVARASGATGLVSVGLAPGLTNLLARECAARLPGATSVDLSLAFGLGGDHGPDSRRWILDGLGRAPTGRRATVVALPHYGSRRVHPFPFSDQDVLTAHLGVPVTTRLCFDSRTLTSVAFAARRVGVLGAAAGRRLLGRLDAALARLPGGDDHFVVQAQAVDGCGGCVRDTLVGRGEARATGIVAARAAGLVYQGAVPAGVHHLHEVVRSAWLDDVLEHAGMARARWDAGVTCSGGGEARQLT